MNIHEVFSSRLPDVEAISKWAGASFLGGFKQWEFRKGQKHVVAVIGMPTSGLPSGQIVVFERDVDGQYGVMLVRRRVYGLVTVKEEAGGIVFAAKDPILVVPWSGVVLDMEQMR